MNVAQQVAAGDCDLRGESADRLHPMSLIKSRLKDAQTSEVLGGDLDDVVRC
jgi:hypothetical protein